MNIQNESEDSETTEQIIDQNLKELLELSGLEGIARREAINHPPHYNQGSIEVIDAIEDWDLDFHAGNVIKYVARYRHKGNPVQDLKKARFYLDRLIEGLENGSD